MEHFSFLGSNSAILGLTRFWPHLCSRLILLHLWTKKILFKKYVLVPTHLKLFGYLNVFISNSTSRRPDTWFWNVGHLSYSPPRKTFSVIAQNTPTTDYPKLSHVIIDASHQISSCLSIFSPMFQYFTQISHHHSAALIWLINFPTLSQCHGKKDTQP